MTCETMNVETMNVYIYENSGLDSSQLVPSGDYYLILASNAELALAGGIGGKIVELFTFVSGSNDQLWAFQGNGNANTAYRVSNVDYADFMTSNGSVENSVFLTPSTTSTWYLNIISMNADGTYNANVGLVQAPTLFIGTSSAPASGVDCILVEKTNALEFIITPVG